MKVEAPLSKKNFSFIKNNRCRNSAIDVGIQKKMYSSGTTTLIISNEDWVN